MILKLHGGSLIEIQLLLAEAALVLGEWQPTRSPSCCHRLHKLVHHLRGMEWSRGNTQTLLTGCHCRRVDGLDIDAMLAQELVGHFGTGFWIANLHLIKCKEALLRLICQQIQFTAVTQQLILAEDMVGF